MKRTSNNLLTQLSNIEIENLTKETKETVITGFNQSSGNKTFTSVDLWSIQRSVRSRTTRRFI